MVHKRLLGLAVLSILLAFPSSASMVSFLVVETGLNEEAASTPYTSLWEGGLMDAFFDAGHIVTNSPAARMLKKPVQDLSGVVEEDYKDAISGGADFFVLGFLEYQNREGRPVPSSIAVKLYRTDLKILVFEQNFPVGSGKDLNEEFRIAQSAGRAIISKITGR